MKQPEDQHTGELKLARPGRPPLGEAAMTAAQRQAAKRQRRSDSKSRCLATLVDLAAYVQQLDELAVDPKSTILAAIDLIANDVRTS